MATLVLIQFERTYIQDFRNRMIKDISILAQYGGKCLGIGEQLVSKEGEWRKNRSIAMFEFIEADKAKRWIESDPAVHQPDFMHGADVIMLPAKQPGRANCWVQLLDISLYKQHADYFDSNYASSHAQTLTAAGGSQTVASTRAYKHRGLWDADTTLIVINQFTSGQAFDDWYSGEAYNQIKGCREKAADSKVICFHLSPLCTTPST